MNRASAITDRLRSEQVFALYQNVTLGVLGASAGAVVLAGATVHLGALDLARGASWVLYISSCAVAHILLRRSYVRAGARDVHWRPWAIWFTCVSFAEGLGWGWGSVFLVRDSGHLSLEMLILVVTLNIAAGAIPAFGFYLPAFFALFLPATVPSVFWGISHRDVYPEANAMLWLMLIFIGAMGTLGVRANFKFKELVILRIRTNELAEDLRKQKDVAEKANLAKSTFLAAASHDLRQPVHALGLFVAALRKIDLPEEASRLVKRIEESTNAMDGLFGALLDISRLDAGVVDVHARPFPVQSILERVYSDYAGEAERKSIALTYVRCSAHAYTDPLLIERIVRNLVSNAVRYTTSGKVLFGCRQRADRIRFEVWDTGHGIAASDTERIFQEYFQLHNPERDRTMGLGLGLAIVRRLAGLLNCPVVLRSEPRRGSCFSIEIPRSHEPMPEEVAIRIAAPNADRGLVLVIDDETAIRDAMHSVLTGWGYVVLTAGSGAEILTKIEHHQERPKVIICDYRLRDNENGVSVIRRLQAQYEDDIPALLITGDTAADRIKEAKASGLLLLHKPVPHAKLRASIRNLIARHQKA